MSVDMEQHRGLARVVVPILAAAGAIWWFFTVYLTQRPIDRWTIVKTDEDGNLVYRIRVERWRR